ncbi:hypothetical protein Q0M94_14365 [Deinococcus radiomollis]|uniref:hypothetical protein n=1 Tax=Deinococcus radiomollis TaxID=468916 RepID=UPI003892257C
MTKWARWGIALLLAGSYEFGESITSKASLLPVGGYVNPETIETGPIPWVYTQFESGSLQGATIFHKEDYYTEYRNGNQQIIEVGNLFYETGGQFDCRVYPLSKSALLFYNLADR